MVDDDDALPDLDPELGALVSAYETATARDGAQIDAALARVTAKLGPAAGAVGLSVTTKVGLVSALVAVVAVAGIVASAPTHEPEPSRPAIETPSASVPVAPSPVVVAPPPSSTVDATPPASTREPEVSAPRVADERRAKPRAPKSTPSPDSLKAELELLRQARSALREGRADDALEIVRRHRREYATSAVAEERDATEVSALCALGLRDEAREKAEAIERRSSRTAEDLLGGCQ